MVHRQASQVIGSVEKVVSIVSKQAGLTPSSITRLVSNVLASYSTGGRVSQANGTARVTVRQIISCVTRRLSRSLSVSQLTTVTYLDHFCFTGTFHRVIKADPGRCIAHLHIVHTGCLLSLASLAILRVSGSYNCQSRDAFKTVFGHSVKIAPSRCEDRLVVSGLCS